MRLSNSGSIGLLDTTLEPLGSMDSEATFKRLTYIKEEENRRFQSDW